MVARGSSGTLSGTRCVCEAQTQDDVSTGGRLCRRVPPRGRDHVSGRNGCAVQVRETEAIVSSKNSKEKPQSVESILMTEAFLFVAAGGARRVALPSKLVNYPGRGYGETSQGKLLTCFASECSHNSKPFLADSMVRSARCTSRSKYRNR
jgi:hypothetical protein